MRWLRRLGRTLFRANNEGSAADELRLHVEMEAEDLVRQGVPPDEARRRALVALGGVEAHRERARDVRGLRTVGDIRRDIGYTFRSLRRAPGFTLVVVLTLALGIGANTTFFSILNTLVLRTLPVADPERLVLVDGSFTNPIWEQIRDRQARVSDGAFAWGWQWDGFDVADGGLKQRVDGALVSGDMFRVLGVNAVRGRTLTLEDDRRGADAAVAVISHRLWRDRFGEDDGIIGRPLTINRVPVTVVGVAPASFFGLDVGRSFDVMVPFALKPALDRDPRALDRRSHWWVSIGARLAPGQSIEQAQAALRAIQPAVREATIPEDYPPQVAAEYLTDPLTLGPAATGTSSLREQYQPALVAIMVVAGLVLLIACANVANLLLARATTRQREISVRLALGASRARVASQLLVESLTLSTLGAVAGLLVATWAAALVVDQLSTWRETVFLDLSLDWRVFAFMVGATTATAAIFGVAPAWSVRAASPQDVLQQGGRGTTGDRRFGARNALVVVQLALSLVLLVASGLFLQTFLTLSRAPVGMQVDALMAVELDLRLSTVPESNRQQLVDRMREAVAALPGVSAVAAASITPLSGSGWNTGIGDVFPPPRDRMSWMNAVSPGWFATVGAAMKDGRDFISTDDAGVVIVNETFARRFLEPGPAVGQMVRIAGPGGTGDLRAVVGLASDVMYRSPREGMVPTLFVPAGTNLTSSLVVRVAPDQRAPLASALPTALRQLDPLVAFTLHSFDDLANATVTQERLTAGLSVAFGVLALVLAGIGLYGVMSYSVNRRRAEIAVRMALGADRRTIARLVVGHGGRLVAAGIVAGAALSWWASRYVQALLFELDAHDVTTMGGAAIVLAVVGLAAAWIPAWRAARTDPAGLLREG